MISFLRISYQNWNTFSFSPRVNTPTTRSPPLVRHLITLIHFVADSDGRAD